MSVAVSSGARLSTAAAVTVVAAARAEVKMEKRILAVGWWVEVDWKRELFDRGVGADGDERCLLIICLRCESSGLYILVPEVMMLHINLAPRGRFLRCGFHNRVTCTMYRSALGFCAKGVAEGSCRIVGADADHYQNASLLTTSAE